LIFPCSIFDFHSVAVAGFLSLESTLVSWFFIIISRMEFFGSQHSVFFVTDSYYDFFLVAVDELLQVKVGLILEQPF
jgi:hypothetical protein